jgi:hypothetical protein
MTTQLAMTKAAKQWVVTAMMATMARQHCRRKNKQKHSTDQKVRSRLTKETKTSSIHLRQNVSQKIQNQTKLQRQQPKRPKAEQQQLRSPLMKETKTSSIHLGQIARLEMKN